MCIFQSEQVIKLRNVLVSLETTSGHWIRQISKKNNWIIMCGTRCWDAVRNTCQNRPTLLSWRLPYHRYEMICHRSLLIRQCHHFDRARLRSCVAAAGGMLNTQFKYREGSCHSSLKHLNWESCAKFDSILLNIQDATTRSLEKVNFKF